MLVNKWKLSICNKEYEEEYKHTDLNEMTEQNRIVKFHIGLEKVRNVMEGFPEDHGNLNE